MGDCMTFPATFEEFAEEYKIVDSKEVYTNGTELIPIFRVKQWLEHKQYYTNLPEVMYRYMFDNNEKAVAVECKVVKNTATGFTLVHNDGREWRYKHEDIGKYVYYTKEEVEKYIEEQGLNKPQ